ncbi:Cysteine-rich receptor-like protein kinase 10 [Hordeum vulgare]|nr:Cysteine-rich receptor-like protein kinase 10 [Hordeum vulgare]
MNTGSSSLSSSRSRSSRLPTLLPVKPEPQEAPLGRRTRNGDIVINEPDASSRLVRPKKESVFLPVKQKHLDMAADDKTALKWAWDDYVREEMERQHRALEEITAWHRGRGEDDVVILDNSDEDAPGPSNPLRHGDLGQGCSKNGGAAPDNDSDYTNFYKLLGMWKAAASGGGDCGDYTDFYKLLDM